MAKKGEQLPLIDVGPEEAKPIVEAAKLYKEIVRERVILTGKETAQKKLVLDMVTKANLQRLADGVIRFTCDDVTIAITPTDDKIKVTEK